MDLLGRDAKNNLNSTDARLAPQKLAFLKNHETDLFGRALIKAHETRVLIIQVPVLMGEAFLPTHIAHCAKKKRHLNFHSVVIESFGK